MNTRRSLAIAATLVVSCFVATVPTALQAHFTGDDEYLTWSAKQAESIGNNAYRRGRVGGLWDTRLLRTERAYNYKLAATWLTPDVIRATARILQLRSRLSDDDTRRLVAEAESVKGTVVMIEIDPREGSGVIPTDWEAFLQPKGDAARVVRGTISQRLRDVKALAGSLRRNYDYDRFWVSFPAERNGSAIFGESDRIAELIVRIHNMEGRVEWTIPASARAFMQRHNPSTPSR